MLQRCSPWLIPHHPQRGELRCRRFSQWIPVFAQKRWHASAAKRLNCFSSFIIIHQTRCITFFPPLSQPCGNSSLASVSGEQAGGCREWDKGFFFFFFFFCSIHSCNTVCSLAAHLGPRGVQHSLPRELKHTLTYDSYCKTCQHMQGPNKYVSSIDWTHLTMQCLIFLLTSSSFSLFGLQ